MVSVAQGGGNLGFLWGTPRKISDFVVESANEAIFPNGNINERPFILKTTFKGL